MTRIYATPLAFKTAVEQRLKSDAAASGMDLQRRRQLFVLDRFLARLFHVLEDAVVLKGGLVIELHELSPCPVRHQLRCSPRRARDARALQGFDVHRWGVSRPPGDPGLVRHPATGTSRRRGWWRRGRV